MLAVCLLFAVYAPAYISLFEDLDVALPAATGFVVDFAAVWDTGWPLLVPLVTLMLGIEVAAFGILHSREGSRSRARLLSTCFTALAVGMVSLTGYALVAPMSQVIRELS